MNLPYKNGKEVVFENVPPQQSFSLRNQETKLTDISKYDIENYLEDMFVSPGQFVVLTAPKAQHKVRYVQATVHDEKVEVELGIEEKGTRLYYKMCTQEECSNIFFDFYDNVFIPVMDEYKPVEF